MRFGRRLGGRRRPPAPDADLIRTLAALLSETGLTEIEYAADGQRVRVARNMTPAVVPAPAAPAPAPEPTSPPRSANGHANGGEHPGTIKAPMVGIAYLASQPGAAPFVRVGETVTTGETLLIIEAMKVMNQIRAPRGGTVSQVFIEDAVPVEYGTALMLIE